MTRAFALAVGISLMGTIFCVSSARANKKPLLPQTPTKYTQMTNPVANDPEAYQIGERIYTLKCAKCHEQDDEGERRGPDLSTAEVKSAPPGALYWVLEKGNGDMPSFAKYPDNYRWQLVTYLQRRK
jgi:mono/diheme cytochrome c family protein